MGYGRKDLKTIHIDNPSLDELNAQLAQNQTKVSKHKKSFFTKTSGYWQPRPLVTFTDDDVPAKIFDVLKPISIEKGVPFTVAACNIFDVITNETLRNQLLDLQNNYGWEIASHTYDHVSLYDMTTEKQMRENLSSSMKDLTDKGFDVENIIYPYGAADRDDKSVVAEYFRSGATTNSTPDDPTTAVNDFYTFDLYGIKRLEIKDDGTKDFAYYQSAIDFAKANNKWLVFYTHVGYASWNAATETLLRQIIDYVKQQSIEIVTLKDGLNYFEPIVQAGDPFKLNDFFNILKNGKINSNFALEMTTLGAYSLTDTIDKYKNPITIFGVNAGTKGWTETGTVITIKGNRLAGYDYQLFLNYNKNEIKMRRVPYSTDLNWTAWTTLANSDELNTVKNSVIVNYTGSNTYTINSLTSDYPTNKITIYNVYDTIGSAFPTGLGGIVSVYNFVGAGWGWMDFVAYNSGAKYTRYVKSDGSWSEWVKVTKTTHTGTTASTYVPNGETRAVNIGVPNATTESMMQGSLVDPTLLPNGIVVSTMINSNGAFRVIYGNISTAPITVPELSWKIKIL